MKRFLAALAALLLLWPFPALAAEVSLVAEETSLAAEEAAPPVITAEAGILIDAGTGQVLAEKNSHKRMQPASLTKIMTCLLGMEAGTPQARVTVTAEALDLMANASTIGLMEGESLTMAQMLRAAMLPSANEAAAAVGIHLAGSSERFAEMMNRKAAELGLTGTHFSNAHGLPVRDHYSTAYDLAQITRAALEYPEFIDYAGSGSAVIPATQWNRRYSFSHLNRTLLPGTGYYDSRAIAGKTGWTVAAGNCLMTVGEQNGVRLIAVVLKADNAAGSVYQDTRNLFDYGFSAYRREEFFLPSSQVTAVLPSGGGGKEQAYVLSANSGTVDVLVPLDLNTEGLTLALSGLEADVAGNIGYWGRLILRDRLGKTVMEAGRVPLHGGTLSAKPLGPSPVVYLLKEGTQPEWPLTAAVAAGCGAVFFIAKLLFSSRTGRGSTKDEKEKNEASQSEHLVLTE